MKVYVVVIISEFYKSEYVDSVYCVREAALLKAEDLNQQLGDEYHVDVEEHKVEDFKDELDN